MVSAHNKAQQHAAARLDSLQIALMWFASRSIPQRAPYKLPLCLTLCAVLIMREDLKYPDIEAAKSVLIKIGINPELRIDQHDQDFEYTSCSLDELGQYISLYSKAETTDHEKRVLGCYFMQCINDHIQEHKSEHPSQAIAFNLMFTAPEIHESELNYWSNARNLNEEHSWPIAKFLVDWKNT